MTDQSIFDQQSTQTTDQTTAAPTPAAQQAQPIVPTYDTQLSMIVNDTGEQKYKSVDEALKGAVHAQTHIATLTSKLAELEKAQDRATTLESVMEAMNTSSETTTATPADVAGLDETQVAEMFNNFYNNAEHEKVATANEQNFSSDLTQAFGDKARETMQAKAKELGVDENFVREMARKSPMAAKKLLGLGSSTTTSSMQSSVNSAALDNGQQEQQGRTFNMSKGNMKDMLSEWNRVDPSKYNQ